MADLREITAAVLAGGLGTRLRTAVADKPKILAEVNGRPFIAYLLDRLADSGIKRVVLCTGYLADAVRDALGSRYRDMELLHSAEIQPLGTGGALRLALPLFSSTPVLVLNGDSYCDVDLTLFSRRHLGSRALASLALATVSDIGRYGAVELAPDNAIARFEEKGSRQGGGLINAGIYFLDRSLIESMPVGEKVSLEQDIFPALIGRGLCGFPQSGRFIDIGIPADYNAAAAFFAAAAATADCAAFRERP